MALKPYLYDDLPALADEIIRVATSIRRGMSHTIILGMLEELDARAQERTEIAAMERTEE